MSGALAVSAAFGATPAAMGVMTPSPISWSDAYGADTAATQIVILSGFTAPISISATKSGGGQLIYVLNGSPASYTGPFTARPNDALGWVISVPPRATIDISGVVTVTNATAGAALDAFNYSLYVSSRVAP